MTEKLNIDDTAAETGVSRADVARVMCHIVSEGFLYSSHVEPNPWDVVRNAEFEAEFRSNDPVTGECDDCGEIGTAVVSVHEPTGVAGWTCPSCGNTQEPPTPVPPPGEPPHPVDEDSA